jgi:ribosomal protein S18 acetylase RimI-like enzyme
MFSYAEERFESPPLEFTYHLAPWDRSAFGGNTAAISSIRLRDDKYAAIAFEKFRGWCKRHEVRLVSCRLAQDMLAECGFLESLGFRFIELNYRPEISDLGRFSGDPDIFVGPAMPSDAAEISAFASETFTTGRLHADPQIGPEIGNRRYAAWVLNAFMNPTQRVLKCMMAGRMIAYFVLEQPTSAASFWSLTGLAPGLAGQGLGKRAWRSMLAFHHGQGVQQVSTSISSLNVAVFNLYVSLGFRFPAPAITMHWCPQIADSDSI